MVKKYLDPQREQLFEMESIPDGPILMLNLLKYKKDVEGKSGKEVYGEYMNAAMPFFMDSKADLVFKGKELMTLIGPIEKYWDEILIVRYPSKSAFKKMATTEGYPSALRNKALEDSRLVMYEAK